jgi:hypothetical protein
MCERKGSHMLQHTLAVRACLCVWGGGKGGGRDTHGQQGV